MKEDFKMKRIALIICALFLAAGFAYGTNVNKKPAISSGF
jgi:hypothetical protein